MTSLRARRITDAVLFDLDGVIVDSRVPFARSVNAALAAHDLPTRPDDELHGYLGPPLHGTFARLGATGPLVQSCVDAYRRRYSAMAAAETPVFAGMRAVIEELARALPLVVATSKPRALAEPLLPTLGCALSFGRSSDPASMPRTNARPSRSDARCKSSRRTRAR